MKERQAAPEHGQTNREKNNDLSPEPSPVDETGNGKASSEWPELVEKLHAGKLTSEQQVRLGQLVDATSPRELVTAMQHVSYSGPLPHPDQLNAYDAETRRVIVQMAIDEQKHSHDMQRLGLEGAINKDKRGQ